MPPRFWAGVGTAVAGVAVLALDGAEAATSAVSGDALAAASGALWAAYILAGRRARARVGATTWQCAVCASAALLLAPAAAARGVAVWGFSRRTQATLLLFVLVPQLIGHRGLDYIVKWLPASTVAALTLLEAPGATALAALLLGETPTRTAVLGGAIATAGVFVAL